MHRSLLIAALFLISSSVVAQTNRNQLDTSDRIGNAKKFYQQGLDLIETRQLPQALESFRQALRFDPEYADAYAALGRTYFKMREWEKAIDSLNRARALNRKKQDATVTPTIQIKPVQPVNAVAAHAPLKLSRTHREIVTSNETTAATINLRNLLPLVEIPPLPVARVEETPLTKIYRVGANDVLDIRLNDGQEQQSTLYTITPAGLLEHPLLTEPMPVAGLTVEEISSRIEDDLHRRAIVETPKALVGVRDYASHSVLVSGLVKDSGTKFLRREAIPLYVVVADAQPLPEAAKVTVVRGGERDRIYEIDLNNAADMNFLVRSGDVVTLHPNATQFIYIGGEIKSPGEKTFRRGLTLMQAILASGGLDPKARIAEIARNNEEGFLIPTRFSLKDIVAGKAVDPVLQPGDRISILRH
jgi:protein involved in polysaccharide export with SLBB domain